MTEKERQAVDAAKASRQTDNQTTRQKGTRVKESATQVGGGLANHIDSASSNLAHNTLKAIAVQTEAKVNHALETGEFLKYFDGMFTNLDTGLNSAIETEYLMLEVLNESPKALPPGDSDGSSSLS